MAVMLSREIDLIRKAERQQKKCIKFNNPISDCFDVINCISETYRQIGFSHENLLFRYGKKKTASVEGGFTGSRSEKDFKRL